MIVALSLSGVIAHPRIFRDAFRLRARDKEGVGLADWHNRLSVWSLPFALAIALTGAMIGLGTIGAYGLAARLYKGDVEAAYAPIFGGEAKPAAPPAPLAAFATHLYWISPPPPHHRPPSIPTHPPST